MEPVTPWHTLSTGDALEKLHSREKGLTDEEAKQRLAEVGPNELRATERVSPWKILAAQFKNVLIVILLVATALSVALGHGAESLVIAVIVLFAVLLGFVQEYRAERAIESLKKLAAPHASVLRSGAEKKVPAREVVPGDVVVLHTGDKVPADARLLEAINLQAMEAALTGESAPIEKTTQSIPGDVLPVGDRKNIVHAGTALTYGRGRAVVAATGMQTEFGRIATMLDNVETAKTPLQKNLDRVGSVLAKVALVVVAVVVALGLFRGQPFVEMFIFGIALAVAVVPEALPAVVTISLALGLQRMVKRNALIRRLPAVETLGSTSVICSDKTGTLTKDEMTVRRVLAGGEIYELSGVGYEPTGQLMRGGKDTALTPALRTLLEAAVLASDAALSHDKEHGWTVAGDPTEGALVVAAAKLGIDKNKLDRERPRQAEVPFSSESRRMATLHRTPSGRTVFVKGAPEVVLSSCTQVEGPDGPKPFDDAARKKVLESAKHFAGEALRVLAIAHKPNGMLEESEDELTLLGLVGMIDPPRAEAFDAIRKCESAGIRAVMITGDHPETAEAVARELGILKQGKVVTGRELEAMDERQLERSIEDIEVFARVSPAHKLRIVTALQKLGHTVAMTGDGVNDAPSLRKADIGIAMGITGTDVSRDAAAMTLTDDSFASIVAAVEEGRRVFGNIKKYLMYLLSSNIGEIGLMMGASLLGLPLPLTAVQILWVNLATDGLPALALAVDPPEDDLMLRHPRDGKAGIFTRPVVTLMLVGGLWSTVVNVGLFAWSTHSGRGLPEAMSMTFVSLVLIQFFKAYNYRSDRRSVLHRPFANKWLNLAIAWELLLLGLILYVPFLENLFDTFALSGRDWLIVGGAAFTVVPVLELAKVLERHGMFGKLD